MASIPDKANRRELCEIICTQKEKIQRYEARLGDLVRAYKGLQKEKDALELSLKALTSQKPAEPQVSSSDVDVQKTVPKRADSTPQASGNAEEAGGSRADRADGGDQQQQDQLATLSQALSTLSEEKARVEAAFQGDRRRLIQEKEAALRQAEEAQRAASELTAALETKLSEMRAKLREEQTGREREQTDHAAMLRELQRLLAEERTTREGLEDKLEEATRRAAQADLAKEYEVKVERLTQELEEVRKRLLLSEEKLRQPSPLLLQLQQELVQVKCQHQAALEKEQDRAGRSQVHLQQQTTGSEARVASLESRLQELSQAVGSYDRLRMQDRAAIQRLKERLSQLAQENAALASAAGNAARGSAAELPTQDSNLDVNTLLERFGKLRSLLKEANKNAEKPVDLIAYFREMAEEEVLGLHAKCRESQRQLKDEFERYKVHAHSVLTGGSTSLPQGQECTAELDRLRQQVKELQGQLRSQRGRHEAQEQASRETILQLQHALSEAELRHRLDCQRLESAWSNKLSELESLMHAQRERSLALVEEKDRELQALRASGGRRVSDEYSWQLPRNLDGNLEDSSEKTAQDGDSVNVDELLDPLLSQLFGSGPDRSLQGSRTKVEYQLLHSAQELARKDALLLRALREKRDAESALRDLQRSVLAKEQKDQQEREALRQRLSQLENLPGPDEGGGVNLQYLKNVVLQYLLCGEAPARKHMLNAIAVGLRFTPQEAQLARQASQFWW
ncbi:GRIP and coiled-coil domain-containing protein 1 [Ixodes scapularis]|uniref:GRIP and coiled-coil domain-containing protein 1 n=1 Tax=Ixodes scapularis TaxID=6945 RepID=UPI001A9EE179|nr:GRIP and coiled-coil domain-containing protein 1 [Ixodes scapularis]